MVSSWLLKVVLGIVLVGVAVIELGSPLVAKAQADDAAHTVADDVAFSLGNNKSLDLQQACKDEAAKHDVTIVEGGCTQDAKGDVVVRVRKEARSVILEKWSVTKDWYHPEASATSKPK